MLIEEIDEIKEAQEKSIEYLAFSGGGAKGAIYSGAKKILDEAGVLSEVRVLAGSSAGAITAALIACGVSNEDLFDITSNTNLKGLLGKGFLINKDGKPLYKLIYDTTLKNISRYIRKNDLEAICSQRLQDLALDKETLEAYEQIYSQKASDIKDKKINFNVENDVTATKELDKLIEEENANKDDLNVVRYRYNQIINDIKLLESIQSNQSDDFNDLKNRCAEKGKIYFKDLDLMSAIDPLRFKKLIVTAVRRDNSELMIFDAINTPNIEVALACRASASIPLIFKPVEIELEIDGVLQKKEFIDGGYRDNTPTKYFGNANEVSKTEGRSLALAFGNQEDKDDRIHIALFSSEQKIMNYGKALSFIVDVVFKMAARIGGVFKYSASDELTAQEIRKKSHDVIALDTKKVSTLSFDEAQAQSYYLHVQGQIQTQEHLEKYGIAKQQDPTLPIRKYLLKVIEITGDQKESKSWTSKAKIPLTEKVKNLLTFCESDKWKDNNNSVVLEEFVAVASYNRKALGNSNDTNTMKNLISLLNDKNTSKAFVDEFRNLLEKPEGLIRKEDFDAIISKPRSTPSLSKPKSR